MANRDMNSSLNSSDGFGDSNISVSDDTSIVTSPQNMNSCENVIDVSSDHHASISENLATITPQMTNNEQKRMTSDEIQHKDKHLQVALPLRCHSETMADTRYYQERKVRKLPGQRNSGGFVKTLQLLFDQEKFGDFLRALPYLTKCPAYGNSAVSLNTTMFQKMSETFREGSMQIPLQLIVDLVKQSGMPGDVGSMIASGSLENSSALIPYNRDSLNFLNPDKLSRTADLLPYSSQGSLHLQLSVMPVIDAPFHSVKTDEWLPVDKVTGAESMMHKEVHEHPMLCDIQNSVLEQSTRMVPGPAEENIMSEEEHEEAKVSNSTDMMQEEDDQRMMTDLPNQEDEHFAASEHYYSGRCQNDEQSIPADAETPLQELSVLNEKSFMTEIKTNEETAEESEEDASTQDSEIMNIPFMHYIDVQGNTSYSENSLIMTQNDQHMLEDVDFTQKQNDVMSTIPMEETSSQPFEPTVDPRTETSSNEMSSDHVTNSFNSRRVDDCIQAGKFMAAEEAKTPEEIFSHNDDHNSIQTLCGESASELIEKTAMSVEESTAATVMDVFNNVPERYDQRVMTAVFSHSDAGKHVQIDDSAMDDSTQEQSDEYIKEMTTNNDGQVRQEADTDIQSHEEAPLDEPVLHSMEKQEMIFVPERCNEQNHPDQQKPATVEEFTQGQNVVMNEENMQMTKTEQDKCIFKEKDMIVSNKDSEMMDEPVFRSIDKWEVIQNTENFQADGQTNQCMPIHSSDSFETQTDPISKVHAEESKEEMTNIMKYVVKNKKDQGDTAEDNAVVSQDARETVRPLESTSEEMAAITAKVSSPQTLLPRETLTQKMKHSENQDAESTEKQLSLVQPLLSLIPVPSSTSRYSPFAGRDPQKYVYRPLLGQSYSPAESIDQRVPGDQEMESLHSAAETTLYEEQIQNDAKRRIDGYFKWKYVPSTRTDDEYLVQKEETDDVPSTRPGILTCVRPRRLGLSRRQNVKRLHKSAHQPT